MKTSGGKEVLLMFLVRPPKTAKSGFQSGLRRRLVGPKEIDPVGRQKKKKEKKKKNYKKQNHFITYVPNLFSVHSLKKTFFFLTRN